VAGDAVRLPFADRSFGAALLLDSLASIQAPDVLFAELARVLRPGAGLGLTAEVGRPLSSAEKARFTRSAPPTVVEEHTLRASLAGAGFATTEVTDHTPAAATVAQRLVAGLTELRDDLVQELGHDAVDDLTATLTCLADLLSSRRVSEVALVGRRAT
jgi:SAM-dependent methyltransferase